MLATKNMNPIEILKQLTRFPTYQVTSDKVENGMKDCASFLSDYLESLGFSVKVDELFNVTAEKTFDGEKSFLMNTHFDTVAPSSQWKESLNPELRGNKLYGLGTSDAKGGIAATLSALSRLENCRFAKLIVQFVNYEDNAIQFHGKRLLGAPFFLSNNPGFTADYGINIEPTVVNDKLTVSVGCTGRVSFTVKTLGKEVHSSTPHLGKNAIYDMVKVIDAIRRISPGKYKVDGFDAEMPVNVAIIQGGRAMNIVPGECKITCERRLFPDEKPQEIVETIRSALEKIEGIKVECDFNPNVQLPYTVDKNEEVVSLVVDSVFRTLGYKPDLRVELGRTDSVYLYHNAGIKTAIIGPGHTGHIAGENIDIDRLLEFTEVLVNMLKQEN
jgi:acetylornithine deacetylase/succinyl-diaminopimelate desuccinylase-like protein